VNTRSDKEMKTAILIILVFELSACFAMNLPANDEKPKSLMDKFNVFYNIHKLFAATKPKQAKVIPYNGLDYDNNRKQDKNIEAFPTDPNKKEEKKDPAQYWLYDKFTNKMDYVLMTKILLKLIVFKKIVKFIALICLLFFIPTLNEDNQGSEEDKNSRNLDVYGESDVT